MIFATKDPLRRSLFAVVMCSIGACTAVQPPGPAPSPTRAEIRVMSSSLGEVPAAGAVTRTTVYETARAVTQVLRLAPGARIAEHHHPSYDETFMVHQGRLTLVLNGKTLELSAGEFVVMPAGTVIAGINAGTQEVHAVVAFSNNGSPGPLTVPGSPHH
jgi:quercetin dioxygenase-like cupin family protein